MQVEHLDVLIKNNPLASATLLVSFVATILINLLSHILCRMYIGPYINNKMIRIEWNTRVASTIHALVIFPMAAYTIYWYYPAITDNILHVSAMGTMTISLSIGYFLADLCFVLYAGPMGQMSNTLGTIIHHIVASICFFVGAFQRCGHIFILMFLVTEVSNPFLNARWFMLTAKMENSMIYLANGAFMTLVFFVARIMLYPFCVYVVAIHFRSMYESRGAVAAGLAVIGLLVGGILNHYWFYLIVKGLWKAIQKSLKKTA